MRLPQIRISQTYAQIGLEIAKPEQTIRQPRPEIELQQQSAHLQIERVPATLEIDQTRAWEEVNLKGPTTLANDWAADSQQQCMEGIARRTEEGRRLAAIEQGNNAIADVAQERQLIPPAPINIKFIPSYGSTRIRFTPVELEMNWSVGEVQIEAITHQPLHEYKPGHVEVYIKHRESLRIEVEERKLDVTA